MKLFGMFGKEKPVPFPQFREMVRLAVRRHDPKLKIENTENGFILTSDQTPVACNLRNLYAAYSKTPGDRDALIQTWLRSLVVKPPDHSWQEAQLTLRPMLKDAAYLAYAQQQMQRSSKPDSLPCEPFVGELSVIIMRDLPGTVIGVTQKQLDAWGVTFAQARDEALNNMGLLTFPPIVNTLLAGGATSKKPTDQRAVGLVFQGDHLTATWLLLERFRDYIGQRLQGDYVVFVPNRSQLTAIRADEPGLLTSTEHAYRNFGSQPHALTSQCYHVSAATTGGVVTVYQHAHLGDSLAADSPFAANRPASQPVMTTPSRPKLQPRALNEWWGLSEPTDSEN